MVHIICLNIWNFRLQEIAKVCKQLRKNCMLFLHVLIVASQNNTANFIINFISQRK